jgi:hypothetical protein
VQVIEAVLPFRTEGTPTLDLIARLAAQAARLLRLEKGRDGIRRERRDARADEKIQVYRRLTSRGIASQKETGARAAPIFVYQLIDPALPNRSGHHRKETERVMFLLGLLGCTIGGCVGFWPWQSWGLRTKD